MEEYKEIAEERSESERGDEERNGGGNGMPCCHGSEGATSSWKMAR
jgi:hypothetical protein